MKAISIRQPYAHLIMCEEKTIECRSWRTDYRGDLLICASASPKVEGTIAGHALCIVSLDDVTPFKRKHLKAACIGDMPPEGAYAWHLSNVRLVKPVPVKGKLNFYNVDDSLIEIIDNGDDSLTDEEAEAIYKEYIEPLLYKGK